MGYLKDYKEIGLNISCEPCNTHFLPLRVGDIITHVNGTANSSAEMLDALKAEKLELTVQRVTEKVVVGTPAKESDQVQGQAEEAKGTDQSSQPAAKNETSVTVPSMQAENGNLESAEPQSDKVATAGQVENQNGEQNVPSDQVNKQSDVNAVEPPAGQS